MVESSQSSMQFLGAAETVTGSKHLIRHRGRQILLDCGLFQGLKALRLRNWDNPPFNSSDIDAVILSHAHIDHVGYLPVLARRGFRGPVYCTAATASLVRLLLLDSAHLQEEEAAYANRSGYSKHSPAKPLYDERDVKATLRLLESRRYHEPFAVAQHATAQFRPAGHILGSASVQVNLDDGTDRVIKVLFSGDIGRWDRPMLHDPEPPPEADYLLIESTYAGRSHTDADTASELARVINDAVARDGVLLIPAFAVGRTQELMWYVRRLEDSGRIPKLPVFIDSPMATDASEIYCQHPEEHDLELQNLVSDEGCPLTSHGFRFTRSREASKELNRHRGPAIIISASGMATGGRIVHHLKQRLPDPSTTVLLVGFQAAGTRGRQLEDGSESIRIHGKDIRVNARIEKMSGLSAHGDHKELMRWLGQLAKPPKRTFTVHGELESCEFLASALRDRGWDAAPARDGAIVPLN